MNKIILVGRLTKDPECSVTAGEQKKIARYTLAVDRSYTKDGKADFIPCIAFEKNAEFAEKYLNKGMKILVEGRLETGSYEKDGKTIYTWKVMVERHEFVERKVTSDTPTEPADDTSFVDIPAGIEGALPFV